MFLVGGRLPQFRCFSSELTKSVRVSGPRPSNRLMSRMKHVAAKGICDTITLQSFEHQHFVCFKSRLTRFCFAQFARQKFCGVSDTLVISGQKRCCSSLRDPAS